MLINMLIRQLKRKKNISFIKQAIVCSKQDDLPISEVPQLGFNT